MDKTGTLTEGEPLARAVVQYTAHHGANRLPANGFRSIAGHGAAAAVDGHLVVVGNRKLMADEHIDLGSLAARRETLAAMAAPRCSPRSPRCTT